MRAFLLILFATWGSFSLAQTSDGGKNSKESEWPTEIGGKALSAWIADLSHTDPSVRETAAGTIPSFGPTARKTAFKPLIGRFHDSDPGVRNRAVAAFGYLGCENKDDVLTLAKELRELLARTSSGNILRLQIFRTLGSLGTDGNIALGGVLAALDDPSWEIRHAAVSAAGRLGAEATDKSPSGKRPASQPAMTKLVKLSLKDSAAAVRIEACRSLMILGAPSPENPDDYAAAVAPLMEAVNERLKVEKDPSVKPWLLVLNLQYDGTDGPAIIKKLENALFDDDTATRVSALQVVSLLGPQAGSFVNPLRQCLKGDRKTLEATIYCIAAMSPDQGKRLLPDLEEFVKSEKDERLKKLAQDAIEAIKKK